MLEPLLTPKVDSYTGRNSYWTKENTVGLGKRYLGSCLIHNGDYYLFGGSTGGSWVQNIMKYNKTTKVWNLARDDSSAGTFNNYCRMAKMPDGRFLAIPVVNGTGSTFIFDPANLSNRYGGPSIGNNPLYIHGVVQIGNIVYIFQNVSGRAVIALNTVNYTVSVVVPNFGFNTYYSDGYVAIGTDIYIIGGAQTAIQNAIWKLDTVTNVVTQVGTMPVAINAHFAYALDSENIAIIGGRPAVGIDPSQNTKYRVYNTKTQAVIELPEPGYSFVLGSACQSGDSLVYVGDYSESAATTRFGTIAA